MSWTGLTSWVSLTYFDKLSSWSSLTRLTSYKELKLRLWTFVHVTVISDPFFSETALTIFMKLYTILDNDKSKKVMKPDYPKKFGSSKKYKKVVKMTVFWLFLRNGSNDFDETCSECRTNQFWAPRENRMSKSFSVLEIIIHKVQILAQIAKSGV